MFVQFNEFSKGDTNNDKNLNENIQELSKTAESRNMYKELITV